MPTVEKCKDLFFATVAIGSATLIMFAFGYNYTFGEFSSSSGVLQLSTGLLIEDVCKRGLLNENPKW